MIGSLRGTGLSWILLSGIFSTVLAQQPTPETQTLHITSRLVVLDVTVTDAKGHFVSGLDKSQFTVFEGKTQQTIQSFESSELHAMPANSAGKMLVSSSKDLERIGNAPVNILVLDERNTPFGDVAYALQMVERYLLSQPEVLPAPTLFVSTSAQNRFTVLHDYTQSRADLVAALRKQRNEGDATAINTHSEARIDPTPVGLNQVVAPLVEIADSVRDLPGRKNIIWIGYGFAPVSTEHLNKKEAELVKTMLHDVDRPPSARSGHTQHHRSRRRHQPRHLAVRRRLPGPICADRRFGCSRQQRLLRFGTRPLQWRVQLRKLRHRLWWPHHQGA